MLHRVQKSAHGQQDLSQTVNLTPEGLVVRLGGQLTGDTSNSLAVLLMKLSARRDAVVIFDLSGVSLFSSLAMGQFVAFGRGALRRGRRVVLVELRPEVEESVRIAGLDRLFEVFGKLPDHLTPGSLFVKLTQTRLPEFES